MNSRGYIVEPNVRCPHCAPKDNPWTKFDLRCSIAKPLLIVIPPGGIHITCPVHPEGHHIFGQTVTM